jgi:hypothetical protein
VRTCLGRLGVALLVAAVFVGCARMEVAQSEPRLGQQSLVRDGVPGVYSRQRESLALLRLARQQFQAGKRPVYVPEQPTDDTLDHARASVYGQLIMAAYKMYEDDPTKLRPTPRWIPAGYKFVAWVQMQDFFFGKTDWKFYGILAVNTLKTNEYVLAIREQKAGRSGLTTLSRCSLFRCLASVARSEPGFSKSTKVFVSSVHWDRLNERALLQNKSRQRFGVARGAPNRRISLLRGIVWAAPSQLYSWRTTSPTNPATSPFS